ncbi:LLM class flavin-dependent oxidoreductase [Nitriliruptoraceae bacterium ZYF776]|nr:LLM class flavin-dependent oxidoreductase [Profundirhabdus halotolerans]
MVTWGVTIGGPYAFLGELAKQVEAKGFDAAWVAETSQDSIVQATVVAQATSRIDVGTNITLAFPRSPTVTALQAWDLNELSGDRFVTGLGSQVKRIIEERFSAEFDQPAKRMAEYVQAMRAVWAMERGEDVTFDGDLYRVLRPGLTGRGRAHDRALPRVYVAAVGPLMTKAAASYADGLLGHPFTSDRYVADDVLPRVADALDDAGRDASAFTVCQGIIVSIADDPEVAIREAKQQIAFYGTTPNYRGVFASYGDEELTDQLRVVFKRDPKDLDALVDAVPDEAVERYAIAGTPEDARDQLAAFEAKVTASDGGLGVGHLLLGGPWYGVRTERLAENLWATLETFARPVPDEG